MHSKLKMIYLLKIVKASLIRANSGTWSGSDDTMEAFVNTKM